MTICDLCYENGTINDDAPETCVECGADMCPSHGIGEFCSHCIAALESGAPGEHWLTAAATA